MIVLLYTVHVLACLFLILIILLQPGRGVDLSVFGGGGTMAAFGGRSALTLLQKATVATFILFVLTTMGIAFLQGGADYATVMRGEVAGESVMAPEEAEAPPPAEPAEPQEPSPEAPGSDDDPSPLE